MGVWKTTWHQPKKFTREWSQPAVLVCNDNSGSTWAVGSMRVVESGEVGSSRVKFMVYLQLKSQSCARVTNGVTFVWLSLRSVHLASTCDPSCMLNLCAWNYNLNITYDVIAFQTSTVKVRCNHCWGVTDWLQDGWSHSWGSLWIKVLRGGSFCSCSCLHLPSGFGTNHLPNTMTGPSSKSGRGRPGRVYIFHLQGQITYAGRDGA